MPRLHVAPILVPGLVLWLTVTGAPLAHADQNSSAADTLSVAAADSALATEPAVVGGAAAAAQAAAQGKTTGKAADAGPFLTKTTFEPKAGVQADVRQYKYYGEDITTLTFREGTFKNTFKWSWEDYRKQEKTTENRSSQFNYGTGKMLPFAFNMNGSWNWSDDLTTNTVGYTNQSRRETKMLTASASPAKIQTGALTNSIKTVFELNDQKSVNQNQRNDFSELSLSGGYQAALDVADGIVLVGRVYGKTTAGDRYLGDSSSSSSASADSTGFGVYFSRGVGTGRFEVTRSNFDRQYLDFRKNSNGLIDTVGLAEEEKVVQELETKDAVSVEFQNTFKLNQMALSITLGRDTDDQDYRVSRIGLKKRQQDRMNLTWSTKVGRDSLALSYKYSWKWDDQRIKEATAFRGKQFTKGRDFDLTWERPLIERTRMLFRYHEGLTQDIAENLYNQNDKDRLLTDASLRLSREWPNLFRTSMIFSYKQAQDLSIRESRSSNNNIKDTYEISPTYLWTISPWLTLDQSYQIFIQYTDYTFSELEAVSRSDNYNKRGNLSTKVTINPTSRLDVIVQHDYNKRFNATRTKTDASGRSFYNKDQIQAINKVDLAIRFRATPDVTFEGATYQTRDAKDLLGNVETTTITHSGQAWVGARVNKRWGKTNPMEVQAVVKKYNAYGPAVRETSADYWEADVWMKWSF